MRKKTHDEYVAEVAIKYPDIEVVGEYIDSKTKITHKHKTCGHIWDVRPNDILSDKDCPKCYGNQKKTHEQYVAELAIKHPDIEVVGEYINANTKTAHKHKTCGHIWDVRPNDILNGSGCPKCYGKPKKTHNEYVAEVAIKRPDYEVVGEYINDRTKIPHKHKICGNVWNVSPNSILSGSGCPKCYEGRSKNELLISKLLESDKRKIKVITEATFEGCRDKIALRFDFYLPYYKVVIEFHGRQHYEPIEYWGGINTLKETQRRDAIKQRYCYDNGITLVRIKYNEDVESKMLNNILPNLSKKKRADNNVNQGLMNV